MIRLSIALISAGAIAYEILLIRLYSIAQWHHFAFMVISIALLGFGASGTALAIFRSWALARFAAVWQVNAALFGVLAVLGFALAQLFPVNPLELAWQPHLFGRVALVYLLLMAPFFCAANCIGLAFAAHGRQSGGIYGFNLVGSGLGAAGIVVTLFALDPSQALRLVLASGFASAALVTWRRSAASRSIALLAVGLAIAVLLPDRWLEPQISEYKALARALDLPGAEIVARASNPVGSVTVVRSPERPFRHAPGMSLRSPVPPPEQLGLFVDGGSFSAIARYNGRRDELAYLDYNTQAAPYHLLHRPDVLLFGLGGGSGILLADRYHRAGRVDVAEINPDVARMLRDDFSEYSGHLLAPGHVRVHIASPRAFVASSAARYDLIQLPLPQSSGAAGAGTGVLEETYAYTIEAFVSYMGHLRTGGMLAITRWMDLPPRDTLKLAATAIEALRRLGIDNPGDRLVLIRSWNTTTLIVKNGVVTPGEIAALARFADERGFDLAYYPGMRREDANRVNLLEQPYFHDGLAALLGPAPDRFIGSYKFDLRPASDDRPYFFDFVRWESLPELLSLRARGAMPLVEWGYLLLWATLAQAAVLSIVLILLPLAFRRGRRRVRRGRGPVAAYFLALGLAFLFIEIALIKELSLFLGHPLYSIAVVLAAFLIFAGLGAGASARLAARWRGRLLTPVDAAVTGIICFAALYLVLEPTVREAATALPQPVKVFIAMALQAPLAFVMGMPFPLGLTRLSTTASPLVPWAWGVNGCASVVSSVLAALLAIHLGLHAVVLSALALYLVAALAYRRLPGARQRGME